MSFQENRPNMSGLENMRLSLKNTALGQDNMLGTLNFTTVAVDEGRAVLEGTPSARHLNLGGRIHGGWALTVMDSSMGSAVMTTLPAGKVSTTATMETKFIRPVAPGRLYRATGDVIKAGRTLAHVQSQLIDVETGKIVGSATGTFAIITNA